MPGVLSLKPGGIGAMRLNHRLMSSMQFISAICFCFRKTLFDAKVAR
jgi:hypothetical protein